MTPGAALALFPFAAVIGIWVAWSDMKYMKIPNRASIALLLVWLVIGFLTVAFGWMTINAWLWGWVLGAIVLVIGFVANALRLIGGGDAKFAAAMAPFFVGSDIRMVLALAAACVIAAVIGHRGAKMVGPLRSATADWVSWTHKDFPMGLALAGTLIFHLLITIRGAF